LSGESHDHAADAYESISGAATMSRLRILVVHNRYQRPGGEDAVVDAEIDMLRRRGHSVEAYLRHNHDLADMNAVETLTQTIW
jgi:hypothetical protein